MFLARQEEEDFYVHTHIHSQRGLQYKKAFHVTLPTSAWSVDSAMLRVSVSLKVRIFAESMGWLRQTRRGKRLLSQLFLRCLWARDLINSLAVLRDLSALNILNFISETHHICFSAAYFGKQSFCRRVFAGSSILWLSLRIMHSA